MESSNLLFVPLILLFVFFFLFLLSYSRFHLQILFNERMDLSGQKQKTNKPAWVCLRKRFEKCRLLLEMVSPKFPRGSLARTVSPCAFLSHGPPGFSSSKGEIKSTWSPMT